MTHPAGGDRITRLGLGCASLGNLYRAIDDAEAAAVVDAAWAAGLRYFDTAPHYGLGLSERRLGNALAGRPRDQYVVSTKVGRLLRPNPRPTGSDLDHGFAVSDRLARRRDYTADGVRRSLAESLERLGLDRVDIALVHDPEDVLDLAIAEALPALVELREQGVIGAVGVGMNVVDPLRRVLDESDVDVLMVAGRWTLLDRSARPLLAAAAARGVAIAAAAPFNSGLLATSWPGDGATFDYVTAGPETIARARALAAVAREYGVTLPQAALQFPLRHPAVATVVVGAASAREITADAQALTMRIPDEAWERLDAVAEGRIPR